jgi:single-strand DNA-binding protein
MNSIHLVGNLTREPELRFLNTGRPVCNLGLASSRRYQVNGEWQEQTSFFNLTVWGDMAENVAASLKKGSRVVVTGRMESREYEHDGQKRTAFDVIVDEIGPSLRWARAEVERITRGDNQQPAMASARRSPDPIYGDETPEEPF